MSYFKKIADVETYANSEYNLHFNYNSNGKEDDNGQKAAGGQAYLAGFFYDNGEKKHASSLNDKNCLFSFKIEDKDILLNDDSVRYKLKPRGTTDAAKKTAKFEIKTQTNISSAITTFLMLPESCCVGKGQNENAQIWSKKSYWLASMWLTAKASETNDNTIVLTPKDCVICGNVGCQNDKIQKYYAVDFSQRISDIKGFSISKDIDPDIANSLKYFADIYDGNKNFLYKEAQQKVKDLMALLKQKYQNLYSGNTDPLTFIKGLAHSDILAAIRAKPFILLAGMSGTGKTRLVRQLAYGCCPEGSDLANNLNKPGNYECIPVRPNWHDSTGLMGYITRISTDNKPKYVLTDFIRFLVKAWLYEEDEIPFFLCLDEMNLAPVEQYFAEYLSVIESRQWDEKRKIIMDLLIRVADKTILEELIDEIYKDQTYDKVASEKKDKLKAFFVSRGGIPIPSNFIVMGTVNMDETTCSFSRKVLDRAMTFELNEVNLEDGLEFNADTVLGSIPNDAIKCRFTHGWQAYHNNPENCEKIVKCLSEINNVLKGTPFMFAYRTRDEIMIYCIERMKKNVNQISLAKAIDEAMSMKILSRIEGDEQIVHSAMIKNLNEKIVSCLKEISGDEQYISTICIPKLNEMEKRLADTGFTSFWT